MAKQTREDPKILAAAEHSMLVRAKALEVEELVERHQMEVKPTERTLQCLAISREAGAGGREIGFEVGERLGWRVYDKNLLDRVAEEFNVSREMLDLVDETHGNWVHDVLGSLMNRKVVPHEKFLAFLTRLLVEVSKQGPAVFIGRAAQFILPRKHLLAVRIVASEKYRIRQVATRTGATEAAAYQSIHALDAGRREFVEKFFHHDVADPHHYDLVINVDRMGKEVAINLILAALAPQTQLAHV